MEIPMKVTADEKKLSLTVEVDGCKYRYTDKIHDEIELGYLRDRLEWYDSNNKLDSCLATEFAAI